MVSHKICLNKRKTRYESDFFELESGQYYKVNFKVKSPEKSLWGIFFYNKEGKKLLYDFHSSVEPYKHFFEHTSYFCSRFNSEKCKLVFYNADKEIKIKDIQIKKVSLTGVSRWINSIYKQIPEVKPFHYQKINLKRTIKSLKNGEKIKIVMLGDSIVNDTSNSLFEVLLKKTYPESRIEIVPSVKGSTGCEYYKKNNNIKRYIIDYNPDLLIIGGISNKGRIDFIRSVIRKVRKSIQPEIIVMNEIFGYKDASWNRIDRTENPFRARLKTLAIEEKIEFFDINAFWIEYLKTAQKPYEFFLRDTIHPNDYGRAIIARFIFYFFQT